MIPIVGDLWFDTQAEQAAEHHVYVFVNSPNLRIVGRTHHPPGSFGPAGAVTTVE